MADAVVRLTDLSKRFGHVEALAGLSCEIRAGEVVGLLGPNGAGKTTTLKLLLGMLRPTTGSAEVLGLDCTTRSREVKERLGYTPDEPAFFDFLTGREVLEFTREVRGLDKAAAWNRLEAAAAALDFTSDLDRLTSGYSLGMKKKLSVLTAIGHAPAVLVLDEPTNALDPSTAAKVRTLLRSCATHDGAAVLISTHLLDMADRLCDRVLVLNRGRLIAEGTPAEVRARAGVAAGASLEDAFLELVA